MTENPTISVVVPVVGHAKHLGDALQSLADQDYPALEAIIEIGEAGSGSVSAAERFVREYPDVFRMSVKKGRDLGQALNDGLVNVAGDILGYLGAEDVLLPRVLHRVATEIVPGRGRYVVMGRSVIVVEGVGDFGVEHPCEYVGYFEHLAIWSRRFNPVSLPSVFWHRSVPLLRDRFVSGERIAVDYELICRLGKHFAVGKVEDLWSACRINGDITQAPCSESEVMNTWIEISRRHWGSWSSILRWRCEASLWLFRRHLPQHARHHARLGEEAVAEGRQLTAFLEFLKAFACSPEMALHRCRLRKRS